jgi:hypothetical protein
MLVLVSDHATNKVLILDVVDAQTGKRKESKFHHSLILRNARTRILLGRAESRALYGG